MASLRQLEYLVAVIDEGSFTRAAELLHVSQPSLSHQLAALERELGTPLVERLPRGARPTPAGRAAVAHARATLRSAGEVTAAARRVAGLETGELRLATVLSATLGILPPVLSAWRRARPGVPVRLREHADQQALAASMAAGEADVAVGPRPEDWRGPVRSLGEEEFVVVAAADDPLAGRGGRGVALAELASRDWVTFAPANSLAVFVDRACARAGFTPRAAVATEQTASVPLLAAAGLGVGLVPANIVPSRFGGAVLRLRRPLRRELVAYARDDAEPLVAAFTTVLTAHAVLMPRHVAARLEARWACTRDTRPGAGRPGSSAAVDVDLCAVGRLLRKPR
jgi:DNA-binding transcriptional LysR family regulator